MPRFLLSLIIAISLCWTSVSRADAPATAPSPELGPMEVVEAMIAAMRAGDDEGIAVLYAFASPGNRARVGPLDRFSVMMREYFPDMLGHERARAASPIVDQERAMIPIELMGPSGALSQYVIMLSVQSEGDCVGCWMTDAVVPPEVLEQMAPGPSPPQDPGA